MHNSAQGNVLFLILIAVVLFAALSYAVTQSSRGGGSIDAEKEQLNTAVIQNYQSLVLSTVMRLEMGGCGSGNVSLAVPGSTEYDAATSEEKECFIYAPEGGGVYYKDVDSELPISCEGLSAGESCTMYSGIVIAYAGTVSGNEIYTTLANEPSATWTEAGAACAALGNGWSLPSATVMALFYSVQNDGDFSGTFPTTEYLTSFENGQYTQGYRWVTNDYYNTRLKTAPGPFRCVKTL